MRPHNVSFNTILFLEISNYNRKTVKNTFVIQKKDSIFIYYTIFFVFKLFYALIILMDELYKSS